MAGMADYLNRTITDPADPQALLLQAAQLLHQAGAIYEADRRAAELGQMSATDGTERDELEQMIQKATAIGKMADAYCREARKHGVQSAAVLIERETKLRQKYADVVAVVPRGV